MRYRVLSLVACATFASAAVGAQAPAQVRYAPGATVSTIEVPLAGVVPNPLRPTHYYLAFNRGRAYGVGDFDGNGFLDIVAAPTLFDQSPERPLRFWLNQGGGRFVDGTDRVLGGRTVTSGHSNLTEVADFNEDGRPDVLLVDQGLELNEPQYPGGRLVLLLSQPDGTLSDASSNLENNLTAFNHSGAVADVNGDGHLDIVVSRLGIPGVVARDGTTVYYGDGDGRFRDGAARLPAEVRLEAWERIDFTRNRQGTGCSTVGDFDLDGTPDIATGSYAFHDYLTNDRTIRFHRQAADGSFTEAGRTSIPAALRDVGYVGPVRTTPDDGLGCQTLAVGDLDGDLRVDVVVFWEGVSKSYVQVLRNDGGFRFSDVTLQALGTYDLNRAGGTPFANYRLVDVNGDGALDLAARSYGETPATLVGDSFVFLNRGDGTFARWLPHDDAGPLRAERVAAWLGCDWCAPVPLLFDADGDGATDVVLVEHQLRATAAPVQTQAVRIAVLRATGRTDGASMQRQPLAIEYHHASLDHYFVTAHASEIAALDSGEQSGWQRTGLSFPVYSGTVPRTSPVCRFYIPPESGDSHFYSASREECDAVSLRFPAFVRESDEVFRTLLPDAVGRCPLGSRPVYRTWNARADTNHRYTTSRKLRDRMLVQRGHAAEGYGPDAVAMCSPG